MYRIIIVDDQREVRRMLRAGLETLGPDIHVTDVPSGEEALLVISQKPADLLVVDVRLPGITGLELKERAKERNPELKLILITGLADPDTRQRVSQAGAEAYFFKPINMADFLETVERCLGIIPDIAPAQEEKAASHNLPDYLSSLRQSLAATAVILMDERGRAVAQAGDMPEFGSESNVIPSIMATLSTSRKVSYFLGMKTPENLLYFRGIKYDLALAHVAETVALLMISEANPASDALDRMLVAFQSAIRELRIILKLPAGPVAQKEEPVSSGKVEADESTPEKDKEALAALDSIFRHAPKKGFKSNEVDAFWDSAAEGSNLTGVTNADALSYEQARRLGLAPEDE
jgi:CheY-like chemotaxis protein